MATSQASRSGNSSNDMPIIHSEGRRTLEHLLKDAPHALLLTGGVGIGLSYIANYFTKGSAVRFTVLPEKDEKVDLEKGTITVDSIRRLYDATRTVEPNGRIIIVDYAERMAPAAQNAFLKLLEEPTEGTRFVLLTHQPELLLPTITSRSQHVTLRPISRAQSEGVLDTLGIDDATKRAQLLFIAEGFPALLTQLAQEDALFSARVAIVKDARVLITGNAYDRMVLAKNYKDSRADALLLVEYALKQLKLSIAQKGDGQSLRALTRLETLHKRLVEQGNIRLQLSATVLN